jgi:hypothetical protein
LSDRHRTIASHKNGFDPRVGVEQDAGSFNADLRGACLRVSHRLTGYLASTAKTKWTKNGARRAHDDSKATLK